MFIAYVAIVQGGEVSIKQPWLFTPVHSLLPVFQDCVRPVNVFFSSKFFQLISQVDIGTKSRFKSVGWHISVQPKGAFTDVNIPQATST